jgi:hypothetical protein
VNKALCDEDIGNIMITVKSKCDNCNSEKSIIVGDRCVNGELVWSESHNCNNCGFAIESDGVGALPEHYRSIMLAQEGFWCLKIVNGNKATIGKVLRKINYNLNQISNLLKLIPGVISEGTKAEMEQLKFSFDKEEIESVIEKSKI